MMRNSRGWKAQAVGWNVHHRKCSRPSVFCTATCSFLQSLQNLFDLFRRRSTLMKGITTRVALLARYFAFHITLVAAIATFVSPAHAVVKIYDGFGDADVNNNG